MGLNYFKKTKNRSPMQEQESEWIRVILQAWKQIEQNIQTNGL